MTMNPFWEFLVTLGAWSQEHSTSMLLFWAVVAVVFGGRELGRLLARRKRS
jgi:hypothetical protein